MATSFTVFSLGTLPIWDTAEGNTTLATGNVNAALGTYGSAGDPLFNDRVEFAPAGTGFAGGAAGTYDLDNNVSNDQFSINGGAAQTFDASMVFNATITYTDGSTANITAVVFQDSVGNTYWAPEVTDNADQAAIEAQPIQSIQLVSPIYANGSNTGYNLTADRADSEPLCFTRGAMIDCPGGPRAIETLRVGDKVKTLDNRAQKIRWIGQRKMAAIGKFAPIRISAGVLGATVPTEFSPQHRILLQGPQAELLFGSSQVFAAAKHLVDGEGITIREGGEVEYFHLLFDEHQIVRANGIASESLLLGATGTSFLDPESVEEIQTLFPEVELMDGMGFEAARPILKAHEAALWVHGRSKDANGLRAA